jgi:hypothetical protein
MPLTQIQGQMLSGSNNTTTTIQSNGTTAITIDSSQNVGIGTSSPTGKLNVVTDNTHNGGATFDSTGTTQVWMRDTDATANTRNWGFQVSGGDFNILRANDDRASGFVTPVSFAQAPANSLIINSSGRVGIGQSNPGANLEVGSTTDTATIRFRSTSSGFGSVADISCIGTGSQLSNLTFSTRNGDAVLERMRIDSSGNLLVGTTNTAGNAGAGIKNIVGTNPAVLTVGASSANTEFAYNLYSTGAGAYRFYVGYGGTVFATSATITSISDVRLKENIQDIDVGLDKVMALKPRKFDWKEGKGKNTKGDRGWIAQEFEQVFPEMIDSWIDPAPEGEEPYKSVNADLIPVLVKAIQELKAIVDTQATKIAELEAKLEAK